MNEMYRSILISTLLLITSIQIKAQEDTTTARIHYEKGWSLYLSAKYKQAGEYFRKAGAIYKKTGVVDKHVSCLAKEMGTFARLGQLDRALTVVPNISEFEKYTSDSVRKELADIYNLYGIVYIYKGQEYYDSAIIYNKKCLDLRKEIIGEFSPQVASSYNNISVIYERQGMYAQSMDYLLKAKAIREKITSFDDLPAANVYLNMGNLFQAKGDLKAALGSFTKSLELLKQHLDDDHPDIAKVYDNLGNVLMRKGEYSLALSYQKKALALALQAFGKWHRAVGRAYNNLGNTHLELNNLDTALLYYNTSLQIRLKVDKTNTGGIGTIYNNIGIVHLKRKDFDKALIYFKKGLEYRGPNYIDTGESYVYLAKVYAALNQPEKVDFFYKKAIERYTNQYLAKSPSLAITYNELGNYWHDSGNAERALKYYQQAILANFINFEDQDIKSNPNQDFESCQSPIVFLETLLLKAEALQDVDSKGVSRVDFSLL